MNSLLENENDQISGTRDREITLGTTWVLLVFFGLAILCAAFFGFGYSLGSKHMTGSTTAVGATPSGSGTFNAFKPSPGSPLAAYAAGKPGVVDTTPVPYTAPSAATRTVPLPHAAPSNTDPQATDELGVARVAPRTPTPAPAAEAPAPQPPAPSLAPATAATGALSMVQIAAVTHAEDAEMVASGLRRRGYAVNIRSEPQDKLLHVQIGPFATRKEADAMRQRLLADGFNAYIK